jgi:hypothetical protein
VYCRTHTTPAIYYASKSIVGGLYVFTFAAPVMVYVKNECAGVNKFETVFESPFVFVVLDRNRVSCFWGKPVVNCVFDTGWTLTTGDVYVTLEVLERLAIAHPSDAINMIFKLLY